MKKREFAEGERYRPIVTIDKLKYKVPTVIIVSGRRYVYDPGTVGGRRRRRRNGSNKRNESRT